MSLPPRDAPAEAEQHTLAELGEFELIGAITADLPGSDSVPVGPGDDAAVVRLDGDLAVSTDTVVGGVHFRTDWSLPHEVGQRAVAAAVADLIAIGARPMAMVVAFSGPGDLTASWALQCAQGVKDEAAKSGIALVGGDTTSGPVIVLTITVMGDMQGRSPVLRSGARPGDVVALRGRVGWSAAGLRVLSRGFRSPRILVEAYKIPEVIYSAGTEAVAAGATSMIDVSDGLLADLGHVATASGVVIDVRRESLPVSEPIRAVAAAAGTDPWWFPLTGGEDHAFAATFPADKVPAEWLVIGSVREGEAQVLVDGVEWEGAPGFDHFKR